jgi:hypothetical protein
MQMNRVVADAHAMAFNNMISHAKKLDHSSLTPHTALSDPVRAINGSAERVQGRDGYTAFYSKPK